MSLMSSSGNRDTEASTSPNGQVITEGANGFKSKITKNDSRSACDLRDTTGRRSYMVTGATQIQRQIPEFLPGRMHSIPKLERQQSTHNVSQDTTLPAPEPEVPEISPDPLNTGPTRRRVGQSANQAAIDDHQTSQNHPNAI